MKIYNVIINGENYEVVKDTDGFFIKPDFLVPGGTAMKPANEPICVARKPLSEKSVAENVLKWGTGGINVDGCRVGSDEIKRGNASVNNDEGRYNWNNGKSKVNENYVADETPGRFPANIILECTCDEVIKGEKGEPFNYKGKEYSNKETSMFNGDKPEAPSNYNDKGDIHTNPMCPCRLMDEQSGISKSSSNKWEGDNNSDIYGKYQKGIRQSTFSDKGGASRFFYQAKVSKKERNMGLDHFEEKVIEGRDSGQDERSVAYKPRPTATKNIHPTVKPVSLMSYLCRLITPPGGTILDPFMGSGSTGIAALLEGFDFIGMDLDPDYVKIAESRIKNYEMYREFLKK
jgi:site-specific DNA-methyltransferase (adenine-specific)